MSSVPEPLLTPDQYLVQERQADFKSEYFRGETFAMAGASREHNLIVANIVGEFRNALKERPCEVYPSDMRVKVSPSGLYTYPDAVVVCEKPQFEDQAVDTLLNPTVLLEVVSESTESYDRGAKSSRYRELVSLKEYVLIAQDRVSIECYVRQPGNRWLLRDVQSIEDAAVFESVDVTIPASEVYRGIDFSEPEPS